LVTAKVEIEVSVIVDVGHGSTGAPDVLCEQGVCDGLKFQASEIFVEAVLCWSAGEKDLGQLVSIEVPDRDAASGKSTVIKALERVIEIEAMGELKPAR